MNYCFFVAKKKEAGKLSELWQNSVEYLLFPQYAKQLSNSFFIFFFNLTTGLTLVFGQEKNPTVAKPEDSIEILKPLIELTIDDSTRRWISTADLGTLKAGQKMRANLRIRNQSQRIEFDGNKPACNCGTFSFDDRAIEESKYIQGVVEFQVPPGTESGKSSINTTFYSSGKAVGEIRLTYSISGALVMAAFETFQVHRGLNTFYIPIHFTAPITGDSLSVTDISGFDKRLMQTQIEQKNEQTFLALTVDDKEFDWGSVAGRIVVSTSVFPEKKCLCNINFVRIERIEVSPGFSRFHKHETNDQIFTASHLIQLNLDPKENPQGIGEPELKISISNTAISAKTEKISSKIFRVYLECPRRMLQDQAGTIAWNIDWAGSTEQKKTTVITQFDEGDSEDK